MKKSLKNIIAWSVVLTLVLFIFIYDGFISYYGHILSFISLIIIGLCAIIGIISELISTKKRIEHRLR